MEKLWISANELLDDAFRLAQAIVASGFRPDYIVAVWRGGTPIGIAVQEYLKFRGIVSDHIAIRTSSYTGVGTCQAGVHVHGLAYLVEHINAADNLLIVDDVFDSGRSLDAILRELQAKCRRNMPLQTRLATVYYKPGKRQTVRGPDYFVHQTERWLVFPHELDGLSLDEIRLHKSPVLAALLAES